MKAYITILKIKRLRGGLNRELKPVIQTGQGQPSMDNRLHACPGKEILELARDSMMDGVIEAISPPYK